MNNKSLYGTRIYFTKLSHKKKSKKRKKRKKLSGKILQINNNKRDKDNNFNEDNK